MSSRIRSAARTLRLGRRQRDVHADEQPDRDRGHDVRLDFPDAELPGRTATPPAAFWRRSTSTAPALLTDEREPDGDPVRGRREHGGAFRVHLRQRSKHRRTIDFGDADPVRADRYGGSWAEGSAQTRKDWQGRLPSRPAITRPTRSRSFNTRRSRTTRPARPSRTSPRPTAPHQATARRSRRSRTETRPPRTPRQVQR